jgi:predicted RNA-binding Zn ribbon-like protein
MAPYPGPLRDGPLSLELHNTRYADAGELVEGLPDDRAAQAWLDAIGARLPVGGRAGAPTAAELVELRDAIREAFLTAIGGGRPSRAGVTAINAASLRAPRAPVARWHLDAAPTQALEYGDATRADVVLSVLAADAIDVLTGPLRSELRACGAPGCVLLFLRGQPRREWCCGACGNRARQARHYARSRTP